MERDQAEREGHASRVELCERAIRSDGAMIRAQAVAGIASESALRVLGPENGELAVYPNHLRGSQGTHRRPHDKRARYRR